MEPPLFDAEKLGESFRHFDSLKFPSSFDVKSNGEKVAGAFQIAGEY